MDRLPDTPVFDEGERKSLEHNQALAPFAAITRSHLFGLLVALGEYACRVDPTGTPMFSERENDAEWIEANRILLSYYSRRVPFGIQAPLGEPYFTPEERETLRLRKYVRGENFSKSEIIGLLDALGRFALKGTLVQQVFGPMTGFVRAIHAHNALISFRDRPFSEEEFSSSVRAVIAGHKSLVS